MRNHALSISELYFESNIVFSPLASIDDVFALSLVNTRKNVAGFHCGITNFFVQRLLTAKRAELSANLDYVNQVLKEGATRAKAVARKVLNRAKLASGLD